MNTIINSTNYVTLPIDDIIRFEQYVFKDETYFDEKLHSWKTITKQVLVDDHINDNTDFRDNDLSQLVPAGVDPGSFRMLGVNPLEIGDTVQSAIEIIENSGLDDIVES